MKDLKFEIDLNGILMDEFGDEKSLAESIKDAVVQNLTKTIKTGVLKTIEDETNKLINSEIKAVITSQLPSFLNELIDKEYQVVDRYGCKKETTTIRNQLINTLTEQMKYVPKNYNSEKNFFTKSIDDLVSDSMNEFKIQYDTKVNEIFVKEALEYAIAKLKNILKLK